MVVALLKIAVKSFLLKLKVFDKCCLEGVTERLIVADCKSVGFSIKYIYMYIYI